MPLNYKNSLSFQKDFITFLKEIIFLSPDDDFRAEKKVRLVGPAG
jgi:hypothetical protein